MLQGAIVSYEETGFLQHFAEGQNTILFSMRGCREIEEQDFENRAKYPVQQFFMVRSGGKGLRKTGRASCAAVLYDPQRRKRTSKIGQNILCSSRIKYIQEYKSKKTMARIKINKNTIK